MNDARACLYLNRFCGPKKILKTIYWYLLKKNKNYRNALLYVYYIYYTSMKL